MLAVSFPIVIAALVAIVANPTVKATVHTLCFTYFMEKDGCVFSSADDRTRCAPEGHPPKAGVTQIQTSGIHRRSEEHSLERRYDTPDGSESFFIAGGNGICGRYDTNEPGVCLWSGAEDKDKNNLGGWLNGSKTSNCGKQVYIKRKHNETALYVPVVDGCSFGVTQPKNGCFHIGVTRNTFYALNPIQKELNQGYLTGLTWDFNNLNGSKSRNGPV